jgi:hypothetical protein
MNLLFMTFVVKHRPMALLASLITISKLSQNIFLESAEQQQQQQQQQQERKQEIQEEHRSVNLTIERRNIGAKTSEFTTVFVRTFTDIIGWYSKLL